ncbi:hypothetical protein [Thiocapsa rosea]|uniref:Uncharacterized protein n=1 Tax=Thiocapsa rosea TaxID=69360 RepID=A0A495VFX0_9GAMM|nr:hypothetical protein [Thiocapsa rosea]RKT47337.1 hypothetical protein BDD21_4904 [Thiocapsa rosea]
MGADIDRLEAKAREAHADIKLPYSKSLKQMRSTRHEAMARYGELQEATAGVWDSMAKGTAQAWNTRVSAFAEARATFKNGKKKC